MMATKDTKVLGLRDLKNALAEGNFMVKSCNDDDYKTTIEDLLNGKVSENEMYLKLRHLLNIFNSGWVSASKLAMKTFLKVDGPARFFNIMRDWGDSLKIQKECIMIFGSCLDMGHKELRDVFLMNLDLPLNVAKKFQDDDKILSTWISILSCTVCRGNDPTPFLLDGDKLSLVIDIFEKCPEDDDGGWMNLCIFLSSVSKRDALKSLLNDAGANRVLWKAICMFRDDDKNHYQIRKAARAAVYDLASQPEFVLV